MSKRQGRKARGAQETQRKVDYRNLRNPFPPLNAFTEDRIDAIHAASLDVLGRLGIKVLLPEARSLFETAGARVDGEMVYLPAALVEDSIAMAPKSILLKGGVPERDITLTLGSLIFQPGAGCPHATDLERGRRAGTLNDYLELTKLTHHFDALHMLPPLVEPQDVPMNVRHYAMMRGQLTLSDKVPFVFSRGTPQVQESFEMLKAFRGVTDTEFSQNAYCYTIINTNSPRQLDVPMAQGIIDFARAGQVSIITPFTLMGAMAPVTVAGALTLSHAEAMAAITLGQITNPGAPMTYGTFTSNVDMKSGAPAFGTPEQVKASLGAGQLARKLGLPWRCAAGSAANINDAQAAHETEISGWGAFLAGATVIIHSAGWLEGGLTISYEKLITDMDMVQTFAELCTATDADDDAIALTALAEVEPSGHFFGATHTMERYQTAFYDPVGMDWSNIGTWKERGSEDANTRATAIWKDILRDFVPPKHAPGKIADLDAYIAEKTALGGAPPES
ncbi:trimethylamine methyltransferase family protein [Octadecabacter sp. G9-8]|uniref:Methyltransferase n=1 Tax=Octadecabacter dasysiphoniae TaxID=2909341 RepID=A0ABS9CWD6_9RHOB|nr:trimethylamine methyltransferase family protein [Octadecabacter dasysiphoniae]MCF2871580.1 trimethylamine methyltransferase family protein [Octadecabacter dasysiphoniae]